jgi:hypothetical protein
MHASFNEAWLGRSGKYIAFFSPVALAFCRRTPKSQKAKTLDTFLGDIEIG